MTYLKPAKPLWIPAYAGMTEDDVSKARKGHKKKIGHKKAHASKHLQ